MSKGGIDRESMYKKLMPSAQVQERSEIQKAPQEVQEIEESFHNKEERTAHVQLEELEQLTMMKTKLVNVTKLSLEAKLDVAIQKFSACNCEQCRHDILALALNSMENKYVVTPDETALELIEGSKIIPALVKAIMIVKEAPRHA